MAIIGLLAITVLMAMKNEDFIFKGISKGIHDDGNNVCLLWATNFSSFLPLVRFLSCYVSDCHCPFPFVCKALITGWLKANQSVCTHEMSVISVLCDGKGISLRLSMLSSYHLTFWRETIQKKRTNRTSRPTRKKTNRDWAITSIQ